MYVPLEFLLEIEIFSKNRSFIPAHMYLVEKRAIYADCDHHPQDTSTRQCQTQSGRQMFHCDGPVAMVFRSTENLLYFRFLVISRLLEETSMEHIEMKCSLDYELEIYCICSIRIPSRKRDTL